MPLPDPVPLGVSGKKTVSKASFEAAGGSEALTTEEEREAYIVLSLIEALQRPLTGAGTEALLKPVFDHIPNMAEVLRAFAKKVLQTLRDGEPHSTVAVSGTTLPVAVAFGAWNGSHREVQPERTGGYLPGLLTTGLKLRDKGLSVAALLAIDVFARETVDASAPGRPLDESLLLDAELSYVPGLLFGYPEDEPNDLPAIFLVNRSLCTPDQLQMLERMNR
ncbi:hypothetical protein GCM10007874_35120 [Labrys miyagiensis]|uniref:Uncharacterized protein n=1 Tax=Labrys miyagiensis TaxID=346912 RepID=A0ABQ6CJZ5_9HYPH|nr:hypothetical protein [Labrys miyagiensis]GLS20495.1 hypothetical protein GCM10007874_35120 [Labrys miyagiensis]